jgi:hypothetical protein
MFEMRVIAPGALVLAASRNAAEYWNLATTSQPFTRIRSRVPNISMTLPNTSDQDGSADSEPRFKMRRCQAGVLGAVFVPDTMSPEQMPITQCQCPRAVTWLDLTLASQVQFQYPPSAQPEPT